MPLSFLNVAIVITFHIETAVTNYSVCILVPVRTFTLQQ